MAEFLIKAKDHWMDSVPKDVRDKWPKDMVDKYNRRCVKGDVIIVKPDGWKWGKREDPKRMAEFYPGVEPDYVVVKAPGLPVENAEEFIVPQTEMKIDLDGKTVEEVVKRRKYNYLVADIEAAKLTNEPITLSSAILATKITDKSITVEPR